MRTGTEGKTKQLSSSRRIVVLSSRVEPFRERAIDLVHTSGIGVYVYVSSSPTGTAGRAWLAQFIAKTRRYLCSPASGGCEDSRSARQNGTKARKQRRIFHPGAVCGFAAAS
ncbi:hypothetical protein MTO96_012647 [Rhipicephalus appendiculatus]